MNGGEHEKAEVDMGEESESASQNLTTWIAREQCEKTKTERVNPI
jgi:hypothetical protein